MNLRIYKWFWIFFEVLLSFFILISIQSKFSSSWRLYDSRIVHFTYIFLIASLLPGIAMRYNPQNFLHSQFMRLTRKHTGIMCYLTSCAHVLWSYLLPTHFASIPSLMSDWMGVIAFVWLTPLFITSNNFSIRFLKSKWKKLHVTIHAILWFILLHVLIKVSLIPSMVIGAIVIADLGSWLFVSEILQEVFGKIENRAGDDRSKPEE
jgi:DMSO/TMAO reductase YedYZ heme-binding membrane subunit